MATAFQGASPQEIFTFRGYCRATGATSFAWDVSIDSNSSVNNLSLGVTGTASTSQDATGSNGVGEKFNGSLQVVKVVLLSFRWYDFDYEN